MILELLKQNGKMTIEELTKITGRPLAIIETEINQLWQGGQVCIDKKDRCYIPPKTSFPTMLLVTFLVFICSFVLVGAIKASL